MARTMHAHPLDRGTHGIAAAAGGKGKGRLQHQQQAHISQAAAAVPIFFLCAELTPSTKPRASQQMQQHPHPSDQSTLQRRAGPVQSAATLVGAPREPLASLNGSRALIQQTRQTAAAALAQRMQQGRGQQQRLRGLE